MNVRNVTKNKIKGMMVMIDNEKLNKFIKEECTESEKTVFNRLTLEDIEGIYEYGCSSYAPSEFIYYYQTHKFFDEHSSDILDMLEDLKSNGIDLNYIPFNKNDLTWLYIEEVISKFMFYNND